MVNNHSHEKSIEAFSDSILYRSIVNLQYLCFTRPNISYAVNMVCQYMEGPIESHFQMVKSILKYIKGILSYGHLITAYTGLVLQAYSDSNGLVVRKHDAQVQGFAHSLVTIVYRGWQRNKLLFQGQALEHQAMTTVAAEIT